MLSTYQTALIAAACKEAAHVSARRSAAACIGLVLGVSGAEQKAAARIAAACIAASCIAPLCVSVSRIAAKSMVDVGLVAGNLEAATAGLRKHFSIILNIFRKPLPVRPSKRFCDFYVKISAVRSTRVQTRGQLM